MTKILYVCDGCEEESGEGSCHSREDLRVLSDGTTLCEGCYDAEGEELDGPWDELPMPEEFVPASRIVMPPTSGVIQPTNE